MIISAGFLFFLWQRIFNKEKNKSPILIGKIGSLFLVIYVLALGNDGFIYEFMRRIGVFIFYIFTLTSQWIFTFSQSIKSIKFSININLLKFISFSQILLFILATPFFLIIKNDSIQFEEYWHGYSSNSMTNSFSMAKSWVSTLVGIAIKEKKRSKTEIDKELDKNTELILEPAHLYFHHRQSS